MKTNSCHCTFGHLWALSLFSTNHHDYDLNTTHKAKTVSSAIALRQNKRGRDWIIFRWPQGDEYLSAQSADVHNVKGFGPPPFLEDHASRLEHANPSEFST
ncbi:unnamed protein product [Penicillium salamii]|uniref:Uncharacterized protein n=1 Tax=Penicillium salamii TaxID=1612424 RepID=A0A9W4J555_9EURO|nr:unnamed protein product [Penicillium salamii]CAG8011096.1 unnamed protein product [Penicillium salamii]CAG8021091.1 unnamed protein product [Penicillium salamii]CAG8120649.1 unnamed protein product [Penicillium salamii]CAG8153506.1 unnamed protein product [Penicillium salamii]